MGIYADMALALDPVRFAQAAGIEADPWQKQLLRSHAARILLNVTRQGGKSNTAALIALHEAVYVPNSLTLLVASVERQSGELFRKALASYRTLGRPVAASHESALQLELDNGSRIVALPGKEGSIRSFSGVNLLVIDEAARVPDALYYAVAPMLAVSSGRLIALSTPFGTRGWWWESWVSTDAWERYEVPATECPRIPASFLEEYRRKMGAWWYGQEFECRFLDAEDSVFRAEDIARMFESEVETWNI